MTGKPAFSANRGLVTLSSLPLGSTGSTQVPPPSVLARNPIKGLQNRKCEDTDVSMCLCRMSACGYRRQHVSVPDVSMWIPMSACGYRCQHVLVPRCTNTTRCNQLAAIVVSRSVAVVRQRRTPSRRTATPPSPLRTKRHRQTIRMCRPTTCR